MKAEIWTSYYYGAWSLTFSKWFDLPFVPFFGMSIFEEKDGYELIVDLSKHDGHTPIIWYRSETKDLYIESRTSWRRPVMGTVIDDIIESHKRFGWTRKDCTNIVDLKELMNKNNE